MVLLNLLTQSNEPSIAVDVPGYINIIETRSNTVRDGRVYEYYLFIWHEVLPKYSPPLPTISVVSVELLDNWFILRGRALP